MALHCSCRSEAEKTFPILCSIRKNCLGLEVNGELLLDWPIDRKCLSLTPSWNRPKNGTLAIGVVIPYPVSRFELIPITG
jgi:hypothetical protein